MIDLLIENVENIKKTPVKDIRTVHLRQLYKVITIYSTAAHRSISTVYNRNGHELLTRNNDLPRLSIKTTQNKSYQQANRTQRQPWSAHLRVNNVPREVRFRPRATSNQTSLRRLTRRLKSFLFQPTVLPPPCIEQQTHLFQVCNKEQGGQVFSSYPSLALAGEKRSHT